MPRDAQFAKVDFKLPELKHRYGAQIHLIDDPYLLLGLSALCSPACKQPQLHYWVSRLYRSLLQYAVNSVFDRRLISRPTRMKAMHAEAETQAYLPDPQTSVVVVNLARAGTVPSYACYDELNYFFEPEGIRQDHIISNRQVDAQGRVVGTSIHGSKIGGSIEDAYVLVPDPMGATGSTLRRACEAYQVHGKARKWIALHLIVTPEYLKNITTHCPDLVVFALRLDRGLSSDKVLKSQLGEYWDQERGLNDKDYIVPGGGGLGEILNNTLI